MFGVRTVDASCFGNGGRVFAFHESFYTASTVPIWLLIARILMPSDSYPSRRRVRVTMSGVPIYIEVVHVVFHLQLRFSEPEPKSFNRLQHRVNVNLIEGCQCRTTMC